MSYWLLIRILRVAILVIVLVIVVMLFPRIALIACLLMIGAAGFLPSPLTVVAPRIFLALIAFLLLVIVPAFLRALFIVLLLMLLPLCLVLRLLTILLIVICSLSVANLPDLLALWRLTRLTLGRSFLLLVFRGFLDHLSSSLLSLLQRFPLFHYGKCLLLIDRRGFLLFLNLFLLFLVFSTLVTTFHIPGMVLIPLVLAPLGRLIAVCAFFLIFG